MIDILCVSNNPKILNAMLAPSLAKFGDNVRLLVIENAVSIFEAYDALQERSLKDGLAGIRVYVHHDVEIIDKEFIEKLEKIFCAGNKWGAVGVIGSIAEHDEMWWNAKKRGGWIWQNDIKLAFTRIDNLVTNGCIVDGLLIATDKKLEWDTKTYGECWHIYDHDICRHVRHSGLNVGIADIEVRHLGKGRHDYNRPYLQYLKKWSDKIMNTQDQKVRAG